MMHRKITVFISYNQKSGNEIADKIQNRLEAITQVVRDKTSLSDWGSIKTFMKSIRNQDMIIMIITDEYLKSSACMFEVVEAMKDENWIEHTMFVVDEGATDVYIPKKWSHYLAYWKREESDLFSIIQSIGDVATTTKLAEELKKVKCISASLIDFLGSVSDSKNPSVDEAVEKIYQKVCKNLPKEETKETNNKEVIEICNNKKDTKLFGIKEATHVVTVDYFDNVTHSASYYIHTSANKIVHMPVLILVDASGSMTSYMELISSGLKKFINNFKDNYIIDHHDEHGLKVPSVDIGIATFNSDFKIIQPFTEACEFPSSVDISATGATNLYTGFHEASEYLIEYIKDTLGRKEKVTAAVMVVIGEGGSTEPIDVLYDDGAPYVFKDCEFRSAADEPILKLSNIYHYIPAVLKTDYDDGIKSATELYRLFPEWYQVDEKVVHRVDIYDVGVLFYWIMALIRETDQYKGMREGKFSLNFNFAQRLHTPWIEALTSEKLYDYLLEKYDQSILESTDGLFQNLNIDGTNDIYEKIFKSVLYLEYEGKQPSANELSSYLHINIELVEEVLRRLLKDRRIRKIGIQETTSYKVIRTSERVDRTRMYLSGSAGTGEKILKNSGYWGCSFCSQEIVREEILYKFNWFFDEQYGYMYIIVRKKDGKMSNESMINTESSSPHKFKGSLVLYNDGSMLPVFEDALQSIGIKNNGVYIAIPS